ncbi:MAG: MBL fold metallo-hydrolase [Acidimicrobiales bacterium]
MPVEQSEGPEAQAANRALLVLGTAAQSPTRERHHNAHVLRWDGQLVLFDPGESAQIQLGRGGVKAAAIDRVCFTHLHGDHCLGLPGFIERRSNDGVDRPLHLHYPAASEGHLRNLLDATEDTGPVDLRLHPVPDGPHEHDAGPFRLVSRPLDHTVPAVGWRLEEPARRHLLTDRLADLGIRGESVGRLQRDGELEVGGRRVTVDEMSEARPGQVFAFVMDTRRCPAAVELARDADLLVCESTYRTGEEDLAEAHGHLTAGQAAEIAREAGARRLVLAHFSHRHPDSAVFALDARPVFPEVVAADDLTWVAVPARR